MFCDNVSYETNRHEKNCSNYCAPQPGQNQAVSYNYLPTQQSQRNPSYVYKNILTGRQQQYYPISNVPNINEVQTMQLMDENAKRQYKRLQAVQRNKNLSAILSIVLAFSQRIQALKQKLCGYPAQNFSPVQFFSVLDLTEKGYVDLHDVRRFVNNDKIRQKDVIALFKRVNGDHSKDNTRLSYFGYLNLIKPYFNEQLARDLLLRDTVSSRKIKNSRKQNNHGEQIDNEMIEPTQQSVLLLFQELILLHCICTSQHQQAKQLLMNDYMLNSIQIKQILGLDSLDTQNKTNRMISPSQDTTSRLRHKSPLSIMYDFIENNSQFEIQFQQMKFLLSFLNVHQFSLSNEKYISLLFLPTNCKKQILQQIQRNKEEMPDYEGTQNYMNTYLTKQNLMNKGNIQNIREFLNQKAQYKLGDQNVKIMGKTLGSSNVNFLEFVHPKSIQRMNQNNQVYQNRDGKQFANPQIVVSPQVSNQHPQFQINASNKRLNQNQSGRLNHPFMNPSQRQYSNSSSIPQQNIKVIPPRQTMSKQDNNVRVVLNDQFYQNQRGFTNQETDSKVSNTPFLEQFMKRSNIIKNNKRQQYQNRNERQKIINESYSKVQSSRNSDSAFQVLDYGYQPSKAVDNSYANRSNNTQKYADQSQKMKKQTLDSRYNLVISQYRGNNLPGDKQSRNEPGQNKLFRINENQSYSKNLGYGNQSYGPKFQQFSKRPQYSNQNPYLGYSKGNYIDDVGLSQSNVVNESNLLNRFSHNNGNILNQFLKS